MSVEGENLDLYFGYKSNMILKVVFFLGIILSVIIIILVFLIKFVMVFGDIYMVRRGGNIIYLRYGFYYIVLSLIKLVMYIKVYF